MTKVLIVEDNTDSAFGLRHLLMGVPGADVRAAHTLADAYSLLREWSPERCVVDLELPDGSGLDFLCDARKSNPTMRSIVCTGSAVPDAESRARACGAEAVLFKPLVIADVLAAVDLPAVAEAAR